jgi:hypothetical protein
MYSIDWKLVIPTKLDDWATKKSMAYLAIHAPGVMLLNIKAKTWPVHLREQSLSSDELTTVEGKSRKKQKSQSSPTPARNRPPPIPTINEEPNESELELPKLVQLSPLTNSSPLPQMKPLSHRQLALHQS